jgi:outer membrane protein OmpA-like peptidoglycan-associated protein
MADSSEHPSLSDDAIQMQRLRDLLLGDKGQVVQQVLQDHARDVVKDVFSEALFDREKQDGSVNKVIMPLVEKSVEKSVAEHSDQMVGYLYPLVGSLVRKSVTAFITDLLEKTNSLLENSFTIKGLKWRFNAWRSGVRFSHYVASQTFAFRVEQVFLIHRETGLLLNTVSADLSNNADADLISAMLTAINDFVSDSFTKSKEKGEQHLDVVKTDDFTLLLKPGPKAVLVAAVSGTMPQKVADQLQLSMEEIHRLYGKELTDFKGDAEPLANSEQQLRDCLISELKAEANSSKKRPWMAWFVVLALAAFLVYLSVIRWQAHQLLQQVSALNQQPGIVVTSLGLVNFSEVELKILRDPSATDLASWLKERDIPSDKLQVIERAYVSLDSELLKTKVNAVLGAFPAVKAEWLNNKPVFSGEFSNLDKLRLQADLHNIAGLGFKNIWLDGVKLAGKEANTADDPAVIRAILDLNIAKLDRMNVEFEQGSSDLSDESINVLIDLKEQFNNLIGIAEQQELSLGLIIMGASDPTGSVAFNKALSQRRADAVQNKLQELGIDRNRLNAIGLGVIELKTSGDGARKVLFNVVYFDSK